MKGNPNAVSGRAVEPLRSIEEIRKVQQVLNKKPRDLALFCLGINTNLRAKDLLALKVKDIRNKKHLFVKETKTKKYRTIPLNGAVQETIIKYLSLRPNADNEEALFLSKQKGHLTVPALSNLVKAWFKFAGFVGYYGTHSLRKTFGHLQWKAGARIEVLMEIFNHSTPRQTKTYLCIADGDCQKVYMNELW